MSPQECFGEAARLLREVEVHASNPARVEALTTISDAWTYLGSSMAGVE